MCCLTLGQVGHGLCDAQLQAVVVQQPQHLLLVHRGAHWASYGGFVVDVDKAEGAGQAAGLQAWVTLRHNLGEAEVR